MLLLAFSFPLPTAAATHSGPAGGENTAATTPTGKGLYLYTGEQIDPDLGMYYLRARWGVRAHQQFTPAARRRLAFTVSASGTYAQAAELATEWGVPVDDSTLHALVEELGARAEAQTARRLETPAPEREPQRSPSALAVLMIDGCQMRYRGPGWGKTNPKEPRVEWHELKLGVFYREEQAAQTAGGPSRGGGAV